MNLRILDIEIDGRRLPLWFEEEPRFTGETTNACTVLIGRNGSGKSRLLAAICQIFDRISQPDRLASDSSLPIGHPITRVTYLKDGFRVEIKTANRGGHATVTVNGKHVSTLEAMPLPSRVIATTVTPFDKLPIGAIKRAERSANTRRLNPNVGASIYRYLGAKDAFGNWSSKMQLSRIVESLVLASRRNNENLLRLTHVFRFLGFEPELFVEYYLRDTSLITNLFEQPNTSPQTVLDLFESRTIYPGRVPKELLNEAPDVWAKALADAVNFIAPRARGPRLAISVTFGDNRGEPDFMEFFEHVRVLRMFGFITVEDVQMIKSDSGRLSVFDASSGEQAVVLTFLGVASEMNDNSLIIIDEPEISLHPEWQERFVQLMYSVFSNYVGCHFLLATHSPQVVSQAGGLPCAVLEMDRIRIVDAAELSKKSADFQLAEAFNTPGYRNEYLARQGLAALGLISRRDFESTELAEKIELLNRVRPQLHDDDPVAQLIDFVVAGAVNPNS